MYIVTEPNLLQSSLAWVLVAEGDRSPVMQSCSLMLRRGGAWAHKEQEEIARIFQGKVPGRHMKLRFASGWQEENYTRVFMPHMPFNLTLNAQNVASQLASLQSERILPRS